MKMSLKNKNILITGATDGLGFELAKISAKNAKNLIVHGRDLNKLKKLKSEINSNNRIKVIEYASDFSNLKTLSKTFEKVISKIRTIDYAFFCHASNIHGTYEITETKKSINLLNCNFISTSIMTKILLVKMKKKNYGSIAYILSGTSIFPLPNYSLYSASKMGLYGLSRSIQIENLNNDVKISLVFPGKLNTNFDKKTFYITNNALNDKSKFSGKDPNKVAKKIFNDVLNGKEFIIFSRIPFLLASISMLFPIIINKIIFKKFVNKT